MTTNLCVANMANLKEFQSSNFTSVILNPKGIGGKKSLPNYFFYSIFHLDCLFQRDEEKRNSNNLVSEVFPSALTGHHLQLFLEVPKQSIPVLCARETD